LYLYFCAMYTITMQPYYCVRVDGEEYVLLYRINKSTWAAVQKAPYDAEIQTEGEVVALDARKCEMLPPTVDFQGELVTEPVFYLERNGESLMVRHPDMMRQMNTYGWTSGLFFCGADMVQWNTADRTWNVNGQKQRMCVMTPRGHWFS